MTKYNIPLSLLKIFVIEFIINSHTLILQNM